MSTVVIDFETELNTEYPEPAETVKTFPETNAEQTPDGAFRRQRNLFPARFGDGPGQWAAEPGRYRLLGSVGCGWCRRQLIAIRLLGLEEALPFVPLHGRDGAGWRISESQGDVVSRWGSDRLNSFYERTVPGFTGRGTSPTIIDIETGKVVTNSYHTIDLDLASAWKPFHRAGAPDLYPEDLRSEINLLNQQIFDDVNNGTYKVIFATNPGAARAALGIFTARLADYDFRLDSRRYLFGDRLTDSDIRLFQTLSSFERSYRPRLAEVTGDAEVPHLQDYDNLWGYARDLFQHGFVDDRELYFLDLLPGPSGRYVEWKAFSEGLALPDPAEALAAWREPSGRERLGGSPLYSGPGSGGSFELWSLT